MNPLDYATYANTYERLYDEEGNYDYDCSSFSELSSIRDGYRYDFNILKDLNDNTTKSRYVSNQVSLKLEFKIMEGLMLSSMGTFSNSNNHSMRELVPGSYASKRASWLAGIYTEGEITDDMNNGWFRSRLPVPSSGPSEPVGICPGILRWRSLRECLPGTRGFLFERIRFYQHDSGVE